MEFFLNPDILAKTYEKFKNIEEIPAGEGHRARISQRRTGAFREQNARGFFVIDARQV